MKKTGKTAPALDYRDASAETIKRVREVLAEAKAHRYSVSLVYAISEQVFLKKETPQICASCLKNKVRDLTTWLEGYDAEMGETTTGGDVKNNNGAQFAELADGTIVELNVDDKGVMAALVDGKKLKAGTYAAKDGSILRVQPGAKVTIVPPATEPTEPETVKPEDIV